MTGFLARVCAEAHERVAEAVRVEPLAVLRERAAQRPASPGFASALSGDGLAVIAEVKRASPSRGRMAAIPDPVWLARQYGEGGAVAISVLTEPSHFDGSLDDLAMVAAGVRLPVLRKDFVVDPYQIWEARAAGAAAVLLIVAALPQPELVRLLAAVVGVGLDALVEVHDEGEAGKAVAAYAEAATGRPLVIGVNARDLSTLKVDPDRFAAVRTALPRDAIAVAESGVQGPADARRLAALGANAILVGEHVATAEDPAAAVRALAEALADQEVCT
ncbi:MAG: indole-3-glycerol phosphate synthase TrpC [Egibacteraceae bacterium]